jgi:hypothetical protein
MPWSFIIPAAVSLFSGSQNRQAASQAADTASAASDRAANLQYQMFQEQQAAQQKALTEQRALQEPWRAAGVNALAKLQGATDYTPFGETQFKQDPGYAFRVSEGMKQLSAGARAGGGAVSGRTMMGAQNYAQGLASQEYGNAFNRYQTERQARLGPLQSLAGVGQTSANTLGQAAGNYATNVGQAAGNYGANVGSLYNQQGINQGNALLAGTQAQTSAYGDIAKLYGQTNPQWGNLFSG